MRAKRQPMPSAMHISKWGPAFWHALHSAAYSYPREPSRSDKLYMKAFLISIGGVLPCRDCCNHYTDFLKTIRMDDILRSRKNLTEFIVDIHNNVNVRAEPSKRKWSVEEAERRWTEHGRSSPEQENCPAFTRHAGKPTLSITPWVLLLFSLIACGVLLYLLRHCRKHSSVGGKRVSVKHIRIV